MAEKIIDLSPKVCKRKNKIFNEGSGRCIDVNSIEVGDKIWADKDIGQAHDFSRG